MSLVSLIVNAMGLALLAAPITPALAQQAATPSSVAEFAASGPVGTWRIPEGACATPAGEQASPLALTQGALTFSTIRCSITAYETFGEVWRVSATCHPNDGGENAKFVFAPLGNERMIMALLAADQTYNYMLHLCEGSAQK